MTRNRQFVLMAGGMVIVVLLVLSRAVREEPVSHPQVFYSDWVTREKPRLEWHDVAGSQDAVVAWLKTIFEREGVPGELVWLAAIESNFVPEAVSHRGATGLFQLMPQVAYEYGLKVEEDDERFIPLYNAQTAARYLADLYERFEDWSLVVAAYNAGESRVARLLRRDNAIRYEAIEDQLPEETRSYVPRVRSMVSFHESVNLDQLRAPYYRRGGVLVVSGREQ